MVLRNGLLQTRKANTTSAFRAWLKGLEDEPSFHVVRGEAPQGNVVIQAMAVSLWELDYDEAGETPDPAFLRECERLGSELRTWLAGPRVERLKDGVRV